MGAKKLILFIIYQKFKGGTTMNDRLHLEGVMSKGYGIIPKLIMKDADLSIEAKAIYAYLSSYSGAGNTSFPPVSLICHDLDISKNRYYKHRQLLLDKDYVRIEQQRNDGNWKNNIYTLVSIPCLQNGDTQNGGTQNEDTQNGDTQNEYTNNNNYINNNNNNNSINNNNDNSDDVVVDDFKNDDLTLIDFALQNNIRLNHLQIAELVSIRENYFDNNDDIIRLAITKTADQGINNFAYVKGILKNWSQRQLTTMEAVQEADKKHEEAKSYTGSNTKNKNTRTEPVPDWVDETPKKETVVDADLQNQFQERLERIRNMKKEKDDEN